MMLLFPNIRFITFYLYWQSQFQFQFFLPQFITSCFCFVCVCVFIASLMSFFGLLCHFLVRFIIFLNFRQFSLTLFYYSRFLQFAKQETQKAREHPEAVCFKNGKTKSRRNSGSKPESSFLANALS